MLTIVTRISSDGKKYVAWKKGQRGATWASGLTTHEAIGNLMITLELLGEIIIEQAED